jgi:uncharacterized membrane protein YkgB
MVTRTPARFSNAHLVSAEGVVHRWLVIHSISVLRVTMGLVFLGFGVLKFFPGVSPAEPLVEATITVMTDGLVPPTVGLVVTALLECAIGISLLLHRWVRLTVYLLVGELLGILSPIVLLPGRMFSGPHHAPSLEGQYVLKDIVLVAAAMVIATQFRGARIVAPEGWTMLDGPPAAETSSPATPRPAP